MTSGKRVRKAHRWVSVLFLLAVLANFAVMPLRDEALGAAVGGATLLPLGLLMVSGLFLLVAPYFGRTNPPKV